jgi:hypothetical protein
MDDSLHDEENTQINAQVPENIASSSQQVLVQIGEAFSQVAISIARSMPSLKFATSWLIPSGVTEFRNSRATAAARL